MSAQTRHYRLFWIFSGVILLVVTVVGAGLGFSNGNGAAPEQHKAGPYPDSVAFVGIGFVDAKAGVANLYPSQLGRVEWVAEEGVEVKKGDVILRLDKRAAEFKVRQAKAAEAAAEATLAEARAVVDQYEYKLEQQKAAVDLAKTKKTQADEALKTAGEIGDIVSTKAAESARRTAQSKVKEAEAGIVVEQNRLLELQKFNPQNKVDLAQADVQDKEALVEAADLALKEHSLVAPSDGTILRVTTRVGEVLGLSPREAAVQFCPKGPLIVRAEVLQEWAQRVKPEQEVIIEDDTVAGTQWKGQVHKIRQFYSQRPWKIVEPFQMNDVRTLEALVEIVPGGQRPLLIGQRVRVTFKKAN